jgi:hypothetical protein
MQASWPMDVFQLASNHLWTAAPGCRVLVIDDGAVRLDIPNEWIVYAPHRHVFVIDRFPPKNRVLLTISCTRVTSDIAAFPLQGVLDEWIKDEGRVVLETHPISLRRLPVEVLWLQIRVRDPDTGSGKCKRLCAARADLTQAIIVFEFDPEEETSFDPHWRTMMDTLVVGDYIADPTTGRKRMTRG